MLDVDTTRAQTRLRAASQPRPLSLRVGEVPVRVEGLPTTLRQRLRALVAPFVVRSLGATAAEPAVRVQIKPAVNGSAWIVTFQGQALRAVESDDALLKYVEWIALTQAVATMTNRVGFHAAALTRGSSTLLLLGKSGEGKTTVTLGLMARGWQPLTDDILLVDPATLAIQPFPRCFHLDESTRELIGDRVALDWPGKLDGYARPKEWAPAGRRATTIMVINRCPTCMAARFPLTQAEGAGALLAEAAGTQLSTSEVARTAVRMAANATCFRMKNGPLEGTLNLIERACER